MRSKIAHALQALNTPVARNNGTLSPKSQVGILTQDRTQSPTTIAVRKNLTEVPSNLFS